MKTSLGHGLGLGTLALSLLLVGCGGGGSHSGGSAIKAQAKATLKVIWPERSARLVPVAANSIVVKILDHGDVVGSATLARPTSGNTSQTDFSDLSVGSFDVDVQAFPNADGSGVAQAHGVTTMATQMDTPAVVNVSLASTAATLSITPTSPRVGKGTTQALTASAHDTDGNLVLLSAGGGDESLVWATSDTAIATVLGSGPSATLKGLTAGNVNVIATLTVDDNGGTLSGTGTPTIVAATGTVIVH